MELIFDAKQYAKENPDYAAQMNFKEPPKKSGSAEIRFNRRFVPLSEKEREELRKEFTVAVVNDYGDEYHLTNEEREKKFRHYQAFAKIRRCKRKFHKLEDFVKVFRLCMDCLKVVADDNGVYPSDKFMRMVIRGKIKVFGLNLPKYIGKDKKDINWEYVTEYIMDRTKNPKDLAKEARCPLDDVDNDETHDAIIKDLEILCEKSHVKEPDEIDLNPDMEYIENHGIVTSAGKKNIKALVSIDPYVPKMLRGVVKNFRAINRTAGNLRSFAFDVREDDFDKIAEIDSKRGYRSISDIPEFKGDIMNRDDYKRYMASLEEYENTQIPVNYNGKMRTMDEVRIIELKDELEKAGWNIRNLYSSKEEMKKLEKSYKRDRKREKELKKRLLKVQSRQKKYKEGIQFNAKKKGKKKK